MPGTKPFWKHSQTRCTKICLHNSQYMAIILIFTMEGVTFFKNHMQSAKGTQKKRQCNTVSSKFL